jgi:hypothetical protein
MSNATDSATHCIAAIERYLDAMKDHVARLEEAAAVQDLAFDRNAWQRSVGLLLSLIEDHGDPALVSAAVRIVNTSPFTGGRADEPRADVARMNVEHTIAQAIAAGRVLRRPVIDDLGDLDAAVKTLEADVGLDPDTSEAEADAMRVVVSYAQLADKMLR